MSLTVNELGELYNPEDFDAPRGLRLKPCGNVRIAEVDAKAPEARRCEACGRPFTPVRGRSAQRYCCRKCAASGNGKKNAGKKKGKKS